ncbi:nucleolar protein 7-like isoform x1 [Plakobranchus ocellatus]|uniref:Nucleolar protein 7-like isoform x1 n=1 Tax=Plakobranchus ocellatus TaxID=259542 RepID=A0AAV3ZLF6_9GAST|nr:nucleolar protein 7-like isoform x1 [Plakobranchus ocellatus]
MNPFDSSSEDEAPEEVSVTSTRQERVEQQKRIQNENRKNKEEEKGRRRQRNEMFRAQKERKLQELSKRKLPQDVLDGIPAKSSRVAASTQEETNTDKNNSSEDLEEKHVDFDDEGFDEVSPDFIPLGSSNLAVVTEDQVSKLRLSSVQEALNFKHSRLYNQRYIPRESTQQRRAKAAKKRANRS